MRAGPMEGGSQVPKLQSGWLPRVIALLAAMDMGDSDRVAYLRWKFSEHPSVKELLPSTSGWWLGTDMIRDTTSEWRGGKKEFVRRVVCIGRVLLLGGLCWLCGKEGSRRLRCRLGSPGTRARCSHMLHAGAATAACFCFLAWPGPRFF